MVAPRLLLALLALLSPSTAAAQGFERSGWQVRQGKWSFEPDGELRCEGSGISSLLYRRGPALQDLEISVEVMFLGPSSSAGLFFRAEGKRFYGETTFYQLEWYTAGPHHGKRLSLMIKKPMAWQQIVVPIQRDPPLRRWIELRVRALGDQLDAFVDGEQVFSKRDRGLRRAGGLGLHVFHARPVKFRRFKLSTPASSGGRR
jgi:hypothetical protein